MNSNVSRVTVLLATYNGVSFLDEQLTSLGEQQNVEVEVLVNDDGSSDGTMEILWKWRDRGLIVSILESTGLGSTKAFLRLLQECDEKPYVAFCDQDDIWEPNKLSMQVELCEKEIPTLVFSRRKYLNSFGESIGLSSKLEKSPSFGNALIENIAPGNTVLLNLPAVNIINSYLFSDVAHYDSWVYLLISAFGQCKYINVPLVQYRIHENNQIGLRKFSFNKFELSALNFIHQASYLFAEPKQILSEQDTLLLNDFTSVLYVKNKRKKALAILKTKFNRQRWIDKIGFKIVFLILVCKGRI